MGDENSVESWVGELIDMSSFGQSRSDSTPPCEAGEKGANGWEVKLERRPEGVRRVLLALSLPNRE